MVLEWQSRREGGFIMLSTLTMADWCIFIAGVVVPVGFTIFAKACKDVDNATPRE